MQPRPLPIQIAPSEPAQDALAVSRDLLRDIAAMVVPGVRSQLVIGNLVNRDFHPDVMAKGHTVTVPLPPIMWWSDFERADPERMLMSAVQITLDRHIGSTVFLPKIATISPVLLETYLRPNLIALAEQLENDLIGLGKALPSYGRTPMLTEDMFWTESRTPMLTEDMFWTEMRPSPAEHSFDAAEAHLFNAKVPEDHPKLLVVSSDSVGKLREHMPRFTARTRNYEEAPGLVGEFKNFHVYRSALIGPDRDGLTGNLAFANNGIALISRRLASKPDPESDTIICYAESDNIGFKISLTPSLTPYDGNGNGNGYMVDIEMLYGVGLLRKDFAVTVNT